MGDLAEAVVREMFRGDNQNPVVKATRPDEMRIIAFIVLLDDAAKRQENIDLLLSLTKPIISLSGETLPFDIVSKNRKQLKKLLNTLIVRRYLARIGNPDSHAVNEYNNFNGSQEISQRDSKILQSAVLSATEGMD